MIVCRLTLGFSKHISLLRFCLASRRWTCSWFHGAVSSRVIRWPSSSSSTRRRSAVPISNVMPSNLIYSGPILPIQSEPADRLHGGVRTRPLSVCRMSLPPLVPKMSRSLLNIEKRSLPRLMLSGIGLASKYALVSVLVRFQSEAWLEASAVV